MGWDKNKYRRLGYIGEPWESWEIFLEEGGDAEVIKYVVIGDTLYEKKED